MYFLIPFKERKLYNAWKWTCVCSSRIAYNNRSLSLRFWKKPQEAPPPLKNKAKQTNQKTHALMQDCPALLTVQVEIGILTLSKHRSFCFESRWTHCFTGLADLSSRDWGDSQPGHLPRPDSEQLPLNDRVFGSCMLYKHTSREGLWMGRPSSIVPPAVFSAEVNLCAIY